MATPAARQAASAVAPDPGELQRTVERLRATRGRDAALALVGRAECALGLRRPRLGLYDHALHLVGGGQKYGCLLAAALADRYRVTLIANRPVTTDRLAGWYGVDLGGVEVEVVELPAFDGQAQPDPAVAVPPGAPNPFAPVSAASARFDLFVNNSMNERVRPRAGLSAAVCHFPERRPAAPFYMARYRPLLCNSDYTRGWIRRRWSLEADRLLYPPVDGGPPAADAERRPLILSVARFERAGSKRQLEMAGAFGRLRDWLPGLAGEWRLVLAGGVEAGGNDYLRRVETVTGASGGAIEVRTNLSAGELAALYRRATLFWHLCGAGARDPAMREHFGMTVAEAMRFGVVPIVYDGGGLPEIVDHGVSGLRVTGSAGLLDATAALIADPGRRRRLAAAAAERAARFGRRRFEAETREIFDRLVADWIGGLGAELERLRDEP